ncbi:hypothetical protein DFO73_112178 [Cytobacillus oceanisediminis]|uniref:Uncharacterized protein n=1 Tax=Cytobacillus oceanisediminis TaxID=665099 RepID=A0A2V2ZNN2_9BACI|nr:hypothetical protein [Cytobacillus oceanisediminis]PWW25885.1 hypothetical protein DFO73_112178 [Cytobacillus oceanisediminis]
MSLEWFDRVSGELQDHLESICSKYDQIGNMSIDRGAKHPRMEFFIETEDNEREYFCTLFFDPHNEEFYVEDFDFELGHTSKTMLFDIEDIIDTVHESLHDYMNGEDDDYYELETDEEDDVIYASEDGDYVIADEYEVVEDEDGDIFEEVDVEWETPEVTAFFKEDEVEVSYQFGVVHETGDGVLRRVNRIWTDDEEMIKDEDHFIFSKEEASTIIAMIASHMDSLSGHEADYQ